MLDENARLDISRAQIEDERSEVGNREVQLVHASVEAIGNRSVVAVRGECLQPQTDAKQPVNGVSLQFLSDTLPFCR
jgi:hypothetical protein